jgi:hypothetical protein
MSGGVAVLLGLLVVAYVGSILVGGRTIRGFGLPSGAEYLVLGVVVGPHGLGLLPRSIIRNLEPIFVCAAAWLALVVGIGYLVVGRRRVKISRALAGIVTAALVGAGVAGALWLVLGELGLLSGYSRLALALGGGFVGCETTRHTVRWVAERHGASGELSDWLADMARASAIVPVLGLGVMFALAPDAPLTTFTVPLRIGTGVAIGVVMGVVAAVLLGREFRRDESWGILLGTSLLAAGVATRLGLAAVATLFVMGLTLSAVSRHRIDIKFMVQPTEKPVLLPVVVVAGASVNLHAMPKLWVLVVVALVARVLSEVIRGLVLVAFVPKARPAGFGIGLGMASTGAISLALAFTFVVRSPGPVSGAVLVIAAAGVLLGELIGPAMLRHSLSSAGETHAVDGEEPAPLSFRPSALPSSDFPERDTHSDYPGRP